MVFYEQSAVGGQVSAPAPPGRRPYGPEA